MIESFACVIPKFVYIIAVCSVSALILATVIYGLFTGDWRFVSIVAFILSPVTIFSLWAMNRAKREGN